MRNILLLTMLLIIVLIVPCAAEKKEIIVEGTYTMSDNDTTVTAENKALLNAKRNAIEQAGTYVVSTTNMKNYNLIDDQIKSISSGIMQVFILDKKEIQNEGRSTFKVKIKAIVTTDELSKYLLQQENEPKTIELADLISLFALSKSERNSNANWSIGTSNKSIKWDTDGVQWVSSNGERIGHAVVTINGTYLTQLRKDLEPYKWEIQLKGKYSDHGVSSVITGGHYSPAVIHREYSPAGVLWNIDNYLNSVGVPHEMVYELGKQDNGLKIYKIDFADKNPVWVTYSWSFGASGAIGDFAIQIHYSLERALNGELVKRKESFFY